MGPWFRRRETYPDEHIGHSSWREVLCSGRKEKVFMAGEEKPAGRKDLKDDGIQERDSGEKGECVF
jgi:hypothetical protein